MGAQRTRFEAMIDDVPEISWKSASQLRYVLSSEKALVCKVLIGLLALRNGYIVFFSIAKLFKLFNIWGRKQVAKGETKTSTTTPTSADNGENDPNITQSGPINSQSEQDSLNTNLFETVVLVSPTTSSGERDFADRVPSNLSDTQFPL